MIGLLSRLRAGVSRSLNSFSPVRQSNCRATSAASLGPEAAGT